VRGHRIVNDGGLVRDWCRNGYGIARKSVWDIDADLKAGALVELLQGYSAGSTGLQIVYPRCSGSAETGASLDREDRRSIFLVSGKRVGRYLVRKAGFHRICGCSTAIASPEADVAGGDHTRPRATSKYRSR
jgi:hypothetical protein